MRFALCILAVFLASFFVFGEELDAVISVGVLNSQATLPSAGTIETFNCNDPSKPDPKFEFTIMRPPGCSGSMDVYYEYYDFASGSTVSGGRFCSLPTPLACKITVPIRLGGKGAGSLTQELFKLYGDCGGVRYEKSFVFALNHKISTTEQNVITKITQAEQLAAAGASPQATQAISTAKAGLEKCDLSNAFNNATFAINNLGAGQTVPSQPQPPGTPPDAVTIPAQPPGLQPNQTTTPNATAPSGQGTGATPPATTPPAPSTAAPGGSQPEAQQKACPLFLAFLPLAAFVLIRKS